MTFSMSARWVRLRTTPDVMILYPFSQPLTSAIVITPRISIISPMLPLANKSKFSNPYSVVIAVRIVQRIAFITNAYELGFPPYVIQRWVGHSRIDQANVYLALRKPAEFVDTEITTYMKLLKDKTVL